MVEEVGRRECDRKRLPRVERSGKKGVVKEITGVYMEKARDFGRSGGERILR